MTLEDLVGEHVLTGVEFGTIPKAEDYDEDANTMSFVLDGHAYCVVEDRSDGYRSSMADIYKVPIESVKNTFAPVRVLGRYRTQGSYGTTDDVLELIDVVTTKIVLQAGTENSDDYYPCFVANFTPENMAPNRTQAFDAVPASTENK